MQSNNNKPKREHKRRVNTRPIDRFYHCHMLDLKRGIDIAKCNGINNEQWRAADRLSNNYQRTILSGGWNVAEPKVDCNFIKNTKIDIQIDAMQKHRRIFNKLNNKSQYIIDHICLKELTLRSYESSFSPKMKKGKGMIIFRNSLNELIEIYRTIS